MHCTLYAVRYTLHTTHCLAVTGSSADECYKNCGHRFQCASSTGVQECCSAGAACSFFCLFLYSLIKSQSSMTNLPFVALSLSLSLLWIQSALVVVCGFIITREFTCYEYLLAVSCCNMHLLEYIQYGTCTVRVTLILSKIGISSIGKYVSLVRWQIKIFAHISKKYVK